ncbi:hypothetical protein TNCV_2690861 [Trichonephila clavipes]|uniref:Uncharacterized protein n=1 Tax=Trichonephila clavipes TaxID=2585209 RepID=A0A8X6VYQ5_TRICX|nr:hypothetical protein TNCV_2690861 [Trichonephila clavipes]
MFACSFDQSVFRSIVDAMYGLRVALGIHQPFFDTREAVRLPDEFFYRTRFIFNPGPTYPPLFEYPGSPSKPDADLPKVPIRFFSSATYGIRFIDPLKAVLWNMKAIGYLIEPRSEMMIKIEARLGGRGTPLRVS